MPKQSAWRNLGHPAVVAFIVAALGALGWIAVKVIEADRSDLRCLPLHPPRVAQAVPVREPAPRLLPEGALYFDAAKVSFTIAHNQKGEQPIRVWQIAATLRPAGLEVSPTVLAYTFDPSGQFGHGIVDINRYDLYYEQGLVTARWIPSTLPEEASERLAEDLLGRQAVTINPEGDDAHYDLDVLFDPLDPGLYEAFLTINYHVGASSKDRALETDRILVVQKDSS